MRNFLFTFMIFFLPVIGVLAQDNPSVEIVLSQSHARQGEVISAEVYVRDAMNVGGIDIGITADDRCLRILDRQPGGYLPTTDAEGAFSPLSELNDHDTRLAAALTDRTKHASGDGVFYRVQLEVTCADGTAALDFSYAKISTYVDPTAQSISLISYALHEGTLDASGAQLTVSPAAQVTAAPTQTPEAEPTASLTPEATPVPQQEASQQGTQVVMLVVLVVIAIVIIGLIFLLVNAHRRRR